jgi:hypothetical protein
MKLLLQVLIATRYYRNQTLQIYLLQKIKNYTTSLLQPMQQWQLSDQEKESVWEETERELQKFQSEDGFVGPCEMVVAVGEKL